MCGVAMCQIEHQPISYPLKKIINVDISQTSQVSRFKSFNIAEMINMGDKTSHHKKNKSVYLYVWAFSKILN